MKRNKAKKKTIIVENALIGDSLETAIEDMKISQRAKDVLAHLCSLSHQSTTSTASTSVDSREGKILVPELRRIGFKAASDSLGYVILTKDGSLEVAPKMQKAAAA